MFVNNIKKIYTIVIILTIIVSISAIVVFLNSASADHNTLDNLIIFVVTILSVLISILAYHISVKTYISIDAVNAISRMDGNVMENENYRTNIISVIRRFNAQKKDEACDQILSYLENIFVKRSIYSGAKLADSIQEMIDLIVLFSFVIERKGSMHNDNVMNRIERLIAIIEKKVHTFEQLSEGSCILIEESVKLLKAVYTYQCYKSGRSSVDIVLLLDVRGAMLKNAISRTIYYNYMGLFYMNKAIYKLQNYLCVHYGNGVYDVLSIESAQLLIDMPSSPDKDLIIVYLNEAVLNFDIAIKHISDELMWNAFIQYNKGRTQYMLSLLSSFNNTRLWKITMKEAIDYRTKLVAVLDDILGRSKEPAYFQRAFIDQLKVAKLMYVRFNIGCGETIEDSALPDIGCDEFNRLRYIKEDILKHTKVFNC
ncbi:MAG: hypothetical protein MR292_06390 [Alistipes sp.]|nr:hypothetical protein [Alistipes sp.]